MWPHMPPGITRCARSRNAASIELWFVSNDLLPGRRRLARCRLWKIYPIARRILYAISSIQQRGFSGMATDPLLLGGICDDFTGGLELASMMVRDGLRTRLLTRLARARDLAELDVA